MSQDILGSLVRALVTVPEDRLGLVQDLALKLAGSDGAEWKQQGKRFLRKEPTWENYRVPAPPQPELLVELVNTVMLAATAEKFVAKDKFVADISPEAKVKISGTGDNFNNWFLAGDSRIEEPIGETELRYHKLLKASVDGPIITTLGGRELVTTGLTHMHSLMEKQPYGPQSGVGPLLTNGWWNIFYVPQTVTKLKGNRFSYVNKAGKTVAEDVSNLAYLFEVNGQWYVLRAVYVYWLGGGWFVHADSVGFSGRWSAGSHVFSRNSALKSLETLAPAQA